MMNGKKRKLHVAVLSDIHLGDTRNTAPEIIVNLDIALPDNAETASLDMIWLAGDVFDKLLFLSNEHVHDIDLWFSRLLERCAKHNIKLRILDGTKSHDWYQSRRVETIKEIMGNKCDIKYVRDLSIEYIPEFDINILYVPDEWQPSTERTLTQVKDLLRAKGLDKVDYAVMHGQFEYQLPAHVEAQKHSSSEYLKLVRGLITIGHVHTYSRYDRIVAQGSFDRMGHNEEEAKGHIRFTAHPDGTHDVVFVENKGAKKFITIRCKGLTLEETLIKIDLTVGGVPDGAYMRVEADADNPILTNLDSVIRNYTRFTWAKIAREAKAEEEEILQQQVTAVTASLTQDNLGQLMMEKLAATGATADMLAFSDEVLTEVL
jgi:hypothetical protein